MIAQGSADCERAAGGAAKTAGAGGQLFVGAGRVNAQAGEGCRSVAGASASADIYRQHPLKGSSAAGQTQCDTETGGQSGGGVVPKSILALDHWLRAERRTCGGVSRLRRKGQRAGRRRTHSNRGRSRAYEAAAAEKDSDVGRYVV